MEEYQDKHHLADVNCGIAQMDKVQKQNKQRLALE